MLILQNYYSCPAVPVKSLPHNKLAFTVNIKQSSQATDDVASQNENEFSGKKCLRLVGFSAFILNNYCLSKLIILYNCII